METANGTILATFFVEHIFYAALLVVLLGLSAFFSGSETAFFHLSHRTVRQFSLSTKKIERLASKTLINPSKLLTALLFGNMLINILYFALTSTMSFQYGDSAGPAAGTLAAVCGFVLLLLLGEMIPKSLAYTNAHQFCLFAAPACYFFLKTLGPIISAIDILIVRPVIQLSIRPYKPKGVSTKQLMILLDSSRYKGLISSNENQLLSEVLKFSFLRVRHVMQPRVEMPSCSLGTSVKTATKLMIDKDLVKIPVNTGPIDSVVGLIHLKDLLLHPERSLSTMIRHAQFVPEQKSVESLIDHFKTTHSDTAVVVDEYGGVAGWVELDDILKQLLGPLEDSAEAEPIEQIGPMEYRIQANLSAHEWMDAFGIDIKQERLVTIGGFVTALLGKIPKEGDEVMFQNVKFHVEQVKQNRIRTIILTLGSIDETKEFLPK